jgi:hypothetical protein
MLVTAETNRVLVAASAAIPILGFHDWEYHRLREVLVYPGSFGADYQTAGKPDENTLGMVGLKQLRGVMILSKPSLLAGFDTPSSHDNVGIHEFAHLVELEESEHGPPPEIPWQAVNQWIEYVARELSHPSTIRPPSATTPTPTSMNSSRCWRSISSSRRTCRFRGRHGGGTNQDRLALPFRAHRQIQSPACHRTRVGQKGALRRQAIQGTLGISLSKPGALKKETASPANSGENRNENIATMNMNPESDKQDANMAAQLTPGRERVVRSEWAGGIPQEMATLPEVRLGRRWLTSKQTLFLAVGGVVLALVVGVLIARYLRTLPAIQAFIVHYPAPALLVHR